MRTYPRYKVAAMHASPVFLDSARTVDKACSLINEAADNGASLVVFPEAFVPCFPMWGSLRAPAFNHDYFRRLAANAIHVPGPELRQIAQTARHRGVIVSIGINEGTPLSVGCLWNTNLLIGSDGRLLNHHRKIVPTFFEKLTWANGDGAGLRVVETELGRVGALICAENCNAGPTHPDVPGRAAPHRDLSRDVAQRRGVQPRRGRTGAHRSPLHRGQGLHGGGLDVPDRDGEGPARRR